MIHRFFFLLKFYSKKIHTYNFFSFTHFPISEGIDPVSSLLCKYLGEQDEGSTVSVSEGPSHRQVGPTTEHVHDSHQLQVREVADGGWDRPRQTLALHTQLRAPGWVPRANLPFIRFFNGQRFADVKRADD